MNLGEGAEEKKVKRDDVNLINKELTEEDLVHFELSIGLKLPEEYRYFLLLNNGGEPETNEFDIPNQNNSCGVNKFLGVNEIKNEKINLGSRLVESALPIAYAECGNLVCITLGEKNGEIYFWDHELEANNNELPSWKNMFFLASSFDEFLHSLRKFDPSQIKLEPEQVESVWIDPGFLKDLGEN